MDVHSQRQSRVLIVDDDPHGLEYFRYCLEKAACRVHVACEVDEARRLVRHLGPDGLDVVLTDYRMPGETGLDLARWLTEQDATLATVLITAQGEKELVQQSMSLGVFDFIDKPVAVDRLAKSIARAHEETTRRREIEKRRCQLSEIAAFDRGLNTWLPEHLRARCEVRHAPLYEAGGDFFYAHECGGATWLLVGDVAGHDLRASWLAAFFQGMIRGLAEEGSSLFAALPRFNRFLREEIAPLARLTRQQAPSLSVCLVHHVVGAEHLCLANRGLPPPWLIDTDGFAELGPMGAHPLGWTDHPGDAPEQVPLAGLAAICLVSDGIYESAADLEIDPLALVYRLLDDANALSADARPAGDDRLLVRYTPLLPTAMSEHYQPIFRESYAGDEVGQIDEIQEIWRRSLTFALADALGDRLFDLLICLREGMLNALIHGCERQGGKVATLHISYAKAAGTLRVRIDDPGKGHRFDLAKRLQELTTPGGKHLGLSLISHLSDRLELEHGGSSLVFDFELHQAHAS